MTGDRIGDYYLESEIRIAEAKKSFERMKKAENGTELKAAFIGFLELTKNVFCPMKRCSHKLDGYEEWWEQERQNLEQSQVAKFFYQQRNDVVKGANELIKINSVSAGPGGSTIQGPLLWYDGMIFLKKKEGRYIPHEEVSNLRLDWDFTQKLMGKSPIELCEEYLRILEGAMESFIQKFPSILSL